MPYSSIRFTVVGVKNPVKNKSSVKKIIQYLISNEKKSAGEICYIFCSDEYLLKLNQKHLNHDTYTDIITFDYSINNLLSGDIFISIDRIAENAKKFSQSKEKELLRVILHGVLHLAGYKDKKNIEKKRMREKENYYLSYFQKAISA
jgi:probable rRNA maturation factor